MQISVDSDIKKASKLLNDIQKRSIPSSTSAALNKLKTEVRKEVVKDVSKSLSVGKRIINKRMSATGAKVKTPRISVSIERKTIGYGEASTALRQTKTGATAGRKGKFPGMFIATMPVGSKKQGVIQSYGSIDLSKAGGGHKGIYFRRTTETKRGTPRHVRRGKNAGKTYRPALRIREKVIYISKKRATNVMDKTAVRVTADKFPIFFKEKLLKDINRRAAKAKIKTTKS